MLIFENDTTASITIEHIPGDELVVASFDWPMSQPIDTYSIDPGPSLTFELDSHFPVRLARIILRDYTSESAFTSLEYLTGEALAAAMQCAPHTGFSVMRLSLGVEQRLAIAQMQIGSPSTPDLLRKCCSSMLRHAETGVRQVVAD